MSGSVQFAHQSDEQVDLATQGVISALVGEQRVGAVEETRQHDEQAGHHDAVPDEQIGHEKEAADHDHDADDGRHWTRVAVDFATPAGWAGLGHGSLASHAADVRGHV